MLTTYRSQRVVTPDGVKPADVVLRGSHIAEVAGHGSVSQGQVIDLGDLVLGPGLVDAHCHINEPGRTDWEGFATATRAAAKGGITLLCDMPLNSEPVTTNAKALDLKVRASRSQLAVDVAFYGGVVPDNGDDAQQLAELSRAGAAAFKCFLCDSGLATFPPADRAVLERAMPALAHLGKRLLAHAELLSTDATNPAPPTTYDDALAARPEDVELRAIDLLAELCETTGCAVHIVHLSAATALPKLARWKEAGLPITVETCPHYLTFHAEEVALDPRYKCTPPIRDRSNREALWQGLADGIIDFIATDHSPCPPDLKYSDDLSASAADQWQSAWGGIASLQLLLPAVWSAARSRGHSIETVHRWLSTTPAHWLGCDNRGTVAAGARADFTVWDPDAFFVVRGEQLEHRHPLTPYEGRELTGAVHRTVLGGREAFGAAGIEPTRGSALRLRLGTATATHAHKPDGLAELNRQTRQQLQSTLEACCSAQAWVRGMVARHPYRSVSEAARASERAFDSLAREDWQQAFDGHPRIGDLDSLKKRYAGTKQLAGAEQAGAADATSTTLAALAQRNAEYEDRFGFVFLVCASGRTAESMLLEVEQRLTNTVEIEFETACEEQRKITFLRLQALCTAAD